MHSDGIIVKNFVLEGNIKRTKANTAIEVLSKEAKNGN
jgi:hypothetical protein